MSPLERIEFVVGDGTATVATSSGTHLEPVGEALGLDQLAAAVRRRLPVPVTVHPRYEPGSAAGATLFVCRPDMFDHILADRPRGGVPVAARIVLVDVPRSQALELAETLGLAATIGTGRFLRWRTQPEAESASGLYGRKDVGVRMGATWAHLPGVESEHYAQLSHAALPDLAALLAAYAETYAAMLLK